QNEAIKHAVLCTFDDPSIIFLLADDHLINVTKLTLVLDLADRGYRPSGQASLLQSVAHDGNCVIEISLYSAHAFSHRLPGQKETCVFHNGIHNCPNSKRVKFL
uniref:Uncharacterized protein n=1 Tax=Aegilops tauschii subsp. strangulata TaxID=200361 RepID=A0A453L996_AEGTS